MIDDKLKKLVIESRKLNRDSECGKEALHMLETISRHYIITCCKDKKLSMLCLRSVGRYHFCEMYDLCWPDITDDVKEVYESIIRTGINPNL